MKRVIKISKDYDGTCTVIATHYGIQLKMHRCVEEELLDWVSTLKRPRHLGVWPVVLGTSISGLCRMKICHALEEKGYYAEVPF